MPYHVKTNQGETISWDVDDKKPYLQGNETPYRRIVDYFSASDSELGYIMLKFADLPITRGGECIWRGEMAQFIYDNL